jgi:hypothetical protein
MDRLEARISEGLIENIPDPVDSISKKVEAETGTDIMVTADELGLLRAMHNYNKIDALRDDDAA